MNILVQFEMRSYNCNKYIYIHTYTSDEYIHARLHSPDKLRRRRDKRNLYDVSRAPYFTENVIGDI